MFKNVTLTFYLNFRRLRLTAEAHGLRDPDLGPDEYELDLDEGEIKSGNQRELNRVKQELAEKKKELEGLKQKVSGLFGRVVKALPRKTRAGVVGSITCSQIGHKTLKKSTLKADL